MSTTIPRAAIYARCSAQRQAEKELSIPAQLDACRAQAKQRGWEVVAEFVDEAESARTADRPQFQEMVSAARAKPRAFEHILVWKFSRFSRSREDSVLYKAMLRRAGVTIISLNEPVDDSAAGRMMAGITEVVDEFYSENLSEDTRRGMRKNASLGFRNGGATPLGYRNKRTGSEASPKITLEPDPVWAPVVQRMFQLALGGQGGRAIAAALDDEGLRSKRGKRFSTQTVLHILRNEVYVGVYIWGARRVGRNAHREADPIRIEDAHPPLASREDFDRVQALLAQRTRKRVHPRRLASNYLLSGLIHCAHCGSPFIGHPAKGGTVHYYGCQRKMKTGAKSCEAKLLNQVECERVVIERLRELVLTPEHIAELVRLVSADLDDGREQAGRELDALRTQQAEAQQRLDRLYAALEDGTLELQDLAPRIRKWRTRRDELVTQREELTAKAEAPPPVLVDETTIELYVHALHRLLERGSLDARKAFLRAWIQRIEARGYQLTIRYTLPPLPTGGAHGLEDVAEAQVLPMAAGAEGACLQELPDGIEAPEVRKAERCSGQVLPFVRNGSPTPSTRKRSGQDDRNRREALKMLARFLVRHLLRPHP